VIRNENLEKETKRKEKNVSRPRNTTWYCAVVTQPRKPRRKKGRFGSTRCRLAGNPGGLGVSVGGNRRFLTALYLRAGRMPQTIPPPFSGQGRCRFRIFLTKDTAPDNFEPILATAPRAPPPVDCLPPFAPKGFLKSENFPSGTSASDPSPSSALFG